MAIAEREHQEREWRAHHASGHARASIEARVRGRVEVIARRWRELR
jgi:hypothetical protein